MSNNNTSKLSWRIWLIKKLLKDYKNKEDILKIVSEHSDLNKKNDYEDFDDNNENKLMGEDSIISLKAKDEKIVYHIRFHLMPGINTNVTNNKKSIILKTKKNNIWLFKSDSEIVIENSIYVDNNTTKEIQQIVIRGITSKTKQIEKWSIEKI